MQMNSNKITAIASGSGVRGRGQVEVVVEKESYYGNHKAPSRPIRADKPIRAIQVEKK
jgi:hypothetical protein